MALVEYHHDAILLEYSARCRRSMGELNDMQTHIICPRKAVSSKNDTDNGTEHSRQKPRPRSRQEPQASEVRSMENDWNADGVRFVCRPQDRESDPKTRSS